MCSVNMYYKYNIMNGVTDRKKMVDYTFLIRKL